LYGSINSNRDQFVAKYIIRFSNGQTWELPVSGQDINAFTNDSEPHKAKRALLARVIPNEHVSVRLLQTAWENPLPDLEIQSIDYISEMSWGAAYLIAITLE
jgi:hypothetical protein